MKLLIIYSSRESLVTSSYFRSIYLLAFRHRKIFSW